jgi:Uma2 family endonuclease
MAHAPGASPAANFMKTARLSSLSAEDYLALERASELRHEYVAGQVFAMGGGRDSHNQVAGNFYLRLRDRLRGGPCRVFFADVKLRIEAADAFYYPDVFVTCDRRDTEPYCKRHAVLVVEVLSASTEAVDRREKLRHYRMLESLREYVLASPEEKTVEIYRREATGDWLTLSLGAGDVVELASVGVRLAMAEIFEDVAH